MSSSNICTKVFSLMFVWTSFSANGWKSLKQFPVAVFRSLSVVESYV